MKFIIVIIIIIIIILFILFFSSDSTQWSDHSGDNFYTIILHNSFISTARSRPFLAFFSCVTRECNINDEAMFVHKGDFRAIEIQFLVSFYSWIPKYFEIFIILNILGNMLIPFYTPLKLMLFAQQCPRYSIVSLFILFPGQLWTLWCVRNIWGVIYACAFSSNMASTYMTFPCCFSFRSFIFNISCCSWKGNITLKGVHA